MYEAKVREDYRKLYEQAYDFLTEKLASQPKPRDQEESTDVESLDDN